MLKLLYITNKKDVALAAENAGVDRIWIDLETIGKEFRQKNLNTVKSKHSIDDIMTIAPFLSKSEMLVRINPWNKNSKSEIDATINAGADILMLPFWKTKEEVVNFLSYVNERCRTILLLETKEAVECIKEIVSLPLLDEIHIGLNDLRISYGFGNMFVPFANGLLDYLSDVFLHTGIPFGIGGIGKLGIGLLPSPEELIIEHYRLGSTAVILSRTFCNAEEFENAERVESIMTKEIGLLRAVEEKASRMSYSDFNSNHAKVVHALKGYYSHWE